MFFSVLKFLGILLEVLLIFNLLIIVHELGHFLAAKWRGLVIERFGIWFGKPIWEKKIGGIWYSLGCIPAGGFVKLPQLGPMEAIEGETSVPKEQLKKISGLDKIIVAFAGPLFSFMLAAVFAVIVWQVGRPVAEGEGTTVIGYVEPGSPAAAADLKAGDKIVSIDGIPVTRWGGQSKDSVVWRIARSDAEVVKMEVEREGKIVPIETRPIMPDKKWYQRSGIRKLGVAPLGRPLIAKIEPGSLADKSGFKPNDLLTHVGGQEIYDDSSIGEWAKANPGKPLVITVERDGQKVDVTFEPKSLRIESVVPDSPASRAGIQKGDRVFSVNGKPTPFPELFIEAIRGSNGQTAQLEIESAGVKKTISVTPEIPLEGSDKPSIGVVPTLDGGFAFDAYGKMKRVYPNPIEQLSIAVTQIVSTIEAVTSSKHIGIQQMGGPVMMMRIYYLLFDSPEGWRMVLWFSVIINVNLALLNMLPLPVLDGGHITIALLEGLFRRPVNVKLLETVSSACAMLLMGFMLFVTFFDVQDLFGGGKRGEMRFKPQGPPPAVAKP